LRNEPKGRGKGEWKRGRENRGEEGKGKRKEGTNLQYTVLI